MVSKYRNIRTVVDGHTFDSKKEARRYGELRLLERAGKISDLQMQVKFEFDINGRLLKSSNRKVTYAADFVYYEKGVRVVEDVKSSATRFNPTYRLKKALMAHVNGVEIKET